MGTLTSCLKKATALDAEDRAAIQEAARRHRKAGLSAKDAAIRAVDEQIAVAQRAAAERRQVKAEPEPTEEPAKRVSARGTARHPDTVMGSPVLAAVSQALGGLDPSWIAEFSTRFETKRQGKDGRPVVQWRNPLIPGVGRLFRRGGTQDLQELAELLEGRGYLAPGTVAEDTKVAGEVAKGLIRAALNREDVQTVGEQQAEAEAAQDAERDAYYAEVDAEAAREAEDERLAIIAANDITPDHMDALDDSDIPFDFTPTEATNARQVQGDAAQRSARQTGQDAAAGTRAADATGGPAARDQREDGQEGLTERFAAGRALTSEQRKQVLSSLVDVYKAKGAPRELKGMGRDGNERSGYVHSPDLFERSDITGAMVRYYVTLLDGRRAHPSELFPDYTQSDIEAEMQRQESAERADADEQRRAEERAERAATATPQDAEAAFFKRNPGFEIRDWRTGETRSFVHFERDGRFYATVSDDLAQHRRLERAGWERADSLLSAQTESDLKAKTERESRAATDDTKEQKRLADKAKADAERGEFTLTGSDRPADVAAAAGQKDIFGGLTASEEDDAARRVEALRQALIDSERDVIMAAKGVNRDDIEAAMSSRTVPAHLKERRNAARQALREARQQLDEAEKRSGAAAGQRGIFDRPGPAPMPAVADIPLSAGADAHRWTSHTPEVRAQQEQDSFRSTIERVWDRAVAAAGNDPAAIARITEVFNDVANGYRSRYLAALGARSRTASAMIAGPARFPVERNRKRLETAHKRSTEAEEYLTRGMKRLMRAARGPIDNSPESELERVRVNLREREEDQERMKAANVALRKGDDEALRDMDFTDDEIAALKKPDFAGRPGYPDYKLSNNNAEIHRLRERLASAEERVAAAAAGPVESEAAAGVRIEENAQDDRLRLFFDEKPNEEVRASLKASAFKWSPNAGAWQRQLTDNARAAARRIIEKHFPKPTLSRSGLSRTEAAAIMALSEETRNSAIGRTVPVERLQAIADAFPSVPIKIAQSVQDLPEQQRNALLDKAPDGKVRGVYFKSNDTIWLVADNLYSDGEALFVAAHEGFHRGLAKTIGPEAKKVLRWMHATNASLRTATLQQQDRHGIDQDEAIEEALADMAGEGKVRNLRGWDKLVKLIRDFLGGIADKLGIKVTWTDDMVADFVAGMRRAGLEGGVHVNAADADASMSRDVDQTQTPEFKRWFGKSAVVDAEGKPLVVYHGTAADFTSFDGSRLGSSTGHKSAKMGTFFSASQDVAAAFAGEKWEGWPLKRTFVSGAQTMPMYLNIRNPVELSAEQFMQRFVRGSESAQAFREQAESEGFDGVLVRGDAAMSERMGGDEYGADAWVAFKPEQIKSAIGNRGTFDPDNADITFSRATVMQAVREQALPAGYKVSDFITSHGKLSWWHRSVGTMHNLAQRNALFKPVYDGAQHFLNDVSYYATEAADLAPTLLPKLDGLRDIAKSPLSAEDTKAIASPIFEGTLNWTRDDDGNAVRTEQVERAGVVWTDAELRERWKLNDKQAGLYREMRAAVDRSLTDLAVSDMIRYGGIDVAGARDAALAAKDGNEAAQVLVDHLQRAAEADPKRAELLNDTAGRIQEKAERAADLMARGYAPLSRFGQFTLDVVGKDGERVYFGLFESQSDANRMARRLKESHPDANFAQGTLSQEAYKLFAGVSPETLELFGDMLGLEDQGDDAASQAFQTYIKIAKSNRSALKRLIERKGIQGFNEDAGRVLAGFVYSNARQSSKNLHFGELSKAVNKIAEDKGQGELLDAAVQLHQYITNPQEEAHKIRGLLFAQFLGGSLAAGIVNLTQSFSVTFPYLTQYGGVKKAAGQMRRALQDAVKWETGNRTTGDAALDAAIKKAEEEGIVSPQEVHHLLAQAGGRGSLKAGDGTKAGDLAAKASNFGSKLMLAWGRPFAIAEQFNRRAAFIAGYRTAVDQGIANPAGFAANVVTESQFSYTKANKPKWARGAIGSTLFTFKTFSISYVELMTRMAKNGPEGKRAALVGLAMLFLMSGMQGLPGADDLDDVIDGALQRLGYNFSSKQAKREFLAGILGEGGAMFVMKGVSGLPGVPIDVAGRLGMGNLIPGTGLLTKQADHGRDVAELLGPAGRLAEQVLKGGDALVQGELMRAAQAVAPIAAANLLKGYDMASMGMYRDDRGRKVIDTDATDAVMKAIGFQPNDVARVQHASMEVQKMIALNKLREAEIAAKWATGMFEKDWDKVKDAQEELRDWNTANPSSRIVITPQQIGRRLKDMRSSKDERIARTAPAEIRAQVKRELEATR
jgi:hypothetical protein